MSNEIRLLLEIEIDPNLTTYVKKTGRRHYDPFAKKTIPRGSSCYSITERFDGGSKIIKRWITEETYKEKFGDMSNGTEAMV